MVKLRSRLIRSPFSGGEASASGSTTVGGETYQQIRGRGGHTNNNSQQRGRNNTNQATGNQQQHQQGPITRRSQRLEEPSGEASPNSSANTSSGATGGTEAVQRRPFRSISRSRSRSLRRRSNASSPGTKRKPESRGITASIRRAKTAMFRMASSPMTSSSHQQQQQMGGSEGLNVPPAAAPAVARAENESMDTSSDDHDHESTSYSTPTGATTSARARASSQEENVPPPMALLSPNIGTSYYAHAAAADHQNNEATFSAGKKKCKATDDPHAMDIDDAAEAAMVPSSSMHHQRGHANKSVLEWMQTDAPPELLTKLLSFCGSRKMATLSRVNKAWNGIMKDESVWRVLCEDTHKWSNGDNIPQSWSQHYKHNPIVPIDYDTVESAFDAISYGPQRDTIENHVLHHYREQRITSRILLHPGPYFLRKPLVANVVGDAVLTIEGIRSVGVSKDPEFGMKWRQNYHNGPSSSPSMMESGEEEAGVVESPPVSSHQQILLPGAYYDGNTRRMSVEARRPSSPTLRQMFGCGRRSSSSSVALGVVGGGDEQQHDEDYGDQSEHRAEFHQSCFNGPGRPTALLCLESRRDNEPVIRVRQGTVNIRGLKFVHYCEGTDIWNGNAAVQVQRAFGRNGRPLRVEPPSVIPTANVSDCDIMSLSGRGVVVIDGAMSNIHNCNVHNSAATGVYVGGAGSMTFMTQTDVIDNGTGNTRNVRRGVARGHSGVYVEQGLAKLRDCNVSGNTLTGISAISTVQARLHIEESCVRANRSDQMELPSVESGRSVNRNNNISSAGPGRPRSERLRESSVVLSPRGPMDPPTPQSPLESDDEL